MITAKIFCSSKLDAGSGQQHLRFNADYAEKANEEWAKATPGLNLEMTVLDSVADSFTIGQCFTLTFTADEVAEVTPPAADPAEASPIIDYSTFGA